MHPGYFLDHWMIIGVFFGKVEILFPQPWQLFVPSFVVTGVSTSAFWVHTI